MRAPSMPVASSHASRVYWRPTAPRCMRSFRASRTVRRNVGWSRVFGPPVLAVTSSRSARRQQYVTPGVARGFPWRNAPAVSMAMNPARRSPPSVPQGAGVVQKGTTSGARLHGTIRLSGDGSASVEARRRLSFVVQRPVERHAQTYRRRQVRENHVRPCKKSLDPRIRRNCAIEPAAKRHGRGQASRRFAERCWFRFVLTCGPVSGIRTVNRLLGARTNPSRADQARTAATSFGTPTRLIVRRML